MSTTALTFWTIGHSNRPLGTFLALLDAHAIEAVADVRRFAGSRRLPHYGAEALAGALEGAGVAYCAFPELGGRRRPDPESVNTGWRNASFRGYADYLATEAFAEGLAGLVGVGGGLRTALLCSEALWWRCHRRLIADALIVLGFEVQHILSTTRVEAHRLAAPARLETGRLTYAAA